MVASAGLRARVVVSVHGRVLRAAGGTRLWLVAHGRGTQIAPVVVLIDVGVVLTKVGLRVDVGLSIDVGMRIGVGLWIVAPNTSDHGLVGHRAGLRCPKWVVWKIRNDLYEHINRLQ